MRILIGLHSLGKAYFSILLNESSDSRFMILRCLAHAHVILRHWFGFIYLLRLWNTPLVSGCHIVLLLSPLLLSSVFIFFIIHHNFSRAFLPPKSSPCKSKPFLIQLFFCQPQGLICSLCLESVTLVTLVANSEDCIIRLCTLRSDSSTHLKYSTLWSRMDMLIRSPSEMQSGKSCRDQLGLEITS